MCPLFPLGISRDRDRGKQSRPDQRRRVVRWLATVFTHYRNGKMSIDIPKEKNKFLSYFDLWDALKKPGCPICTLVERHSFLFLNGLLYERVNDPGTRVELRKSLGFCNWHAWKALEVGNCALGLGIIYEDILRRIEERLNNFKNSFPLPREPFPLGFFRRKKGPPPLLQLGPNDRCPVCKSSRFFEEHYLGILLDFISEEDFATQFARSFGICFFHLNETIKGYPHHKSLPLLIKKQIEKLTFLRGEVAEFVRKQDYQYTAEPSGTEIDSWRRSLEMVVGKREIFPGHMRRESVELESSFDPSPAAIQDSPPSSFEESDGQPGIIEKLKFENEKLRRKYEELKEEYNKESSRAASLHQIAWKMTEGTKTLKMKVEEAETQIKEFAERFEEMNKEIKRVKELLKKEG